jgi:hypothetical protein
MPKEVVFKPKENFSHDTIRIHASPNNIHNDQVSYSSKYDSNQNGIVRIKMKPYNILNMKNLKNG